MKAFKVKVKVKINHVQIGMHISNSYDQFRFMIVQVCVRSQVYLPTRDGVLGSDTKQCCLSNAHMMALTSIDTDGLPVSVFNTC